MFFYIRPDMAVFVGKKKGCEPLGWHPDVVIEN